MIGIALTLALSLSMAAAIAMLARRRTPRPAIPGQLTPAQRRRLYKRLGLDPALMVRGYRVYVANMVPSSVEARRRKNTEA